MDTISPLTSKVTSRRKVSGAQRCPRSSMLPSVRATAWKFCACCMNVGPELRLVLDQARAQRAANGRLHLGFQLDRRGGGIDVHARRARARVLERRRRLRLGAGRAANERAGSRARTQERAQNPADGHRQLRVIAAQVPALGAGPRSRGGQVLEHLLVHAGELVEGASQLGRRGRRQVDARVGGPVKSGPGRGHQALGRALPAPAGARGRPSEATAAAAARGSFYS